MVQLEDETYIEAYDAVCTLVDILRRNPEPVRGWTALTAEKFSKLCAELNGQASVKETMRRIIKKQGVEPIYND